MSDGLVGVDPDLLSALSCELGRLAEGATVGASQVAMITMAASLPTGAAALLARVADDAATAARRATSVTDAMMGAARRWRAPGQVDDLVADPIADALELVRAHRSSLDDDGDGRLEESELRDAVDDPDPAVSAAARFLLDGAPAFPSPTSADAPRPTVPELLAVLNTVAPSELSRLVTDVAIDVAERGEPRAVTFGVVAAGVPFDASEREEGELMSSEPITVPTLDRLRAWDVPGDGVDLSVLDDPDLAVPAATASIALTYRSETVFHEYTIDPLPDDVPTAMADTLADMSAVSEGLSGRFDRVGQYIDAALVGVTAWNVYDDLIGDAHQRMDTNVEFDATFYDADGRVLGTADSVGVDRTGVTGPLLPSVGSVLVVPAPATRRRRRDGDGGP